MKFLPLVLALFFSLVPAVPASAVEAVPDVALADPVLEARARNLFRELRCVVCQGQSIAESNADLAADLRQLVRERIAAGATDEEIKDFLVDRYGVFILMQPPLRQDTYILWFGPALLLLLGAGVVGLTVSRARRRAALEPAGDELETGG